MKRFIFFTALLFNTIYFWAQNPVTVQILVQPPYSSHIEDYTSYENKLVMILSGQTNPNMTPYEVYFKGFLQGDNGVRVETDDTYKPPTPVEIPSGGSISFQGDDLDFFSSEHMTVTGTSTKSIILSDGLPEGYYHICIRAFDYNTDQPLSAEEPLGCSADFGVFHLDPPQILFPVCGEKIISTENQNIAFSWTIPINSPPNTQYTLTLTELQDGQSPEDASQAMPYPPFFETNTSTNSYVYSMADPQLLKGKTYIVQVRAFDPEGKTEFNNNGYSEVCTFQYGNKLVLFDNPDLVKTDTSISFFHLDTILKPVIKSPPKFVSTKICGKIQYKYPGQQGDELYPMKRANVKLIVDYTIGNPDDEFTSFLNDNDYGTGIPSGYTIATTTTGIDGSYCFEYLSNIKFGVIGDYIDQGIRMFTPIPIYRILRVEIEAPHSEYYEQYSYNAKIVNFGEEQNNVNFKFNVKAFDLNVNLEWKDLVVNLFNAKYLYSTGNLAGVPIYILRKKKVPMTWSHPFPNDDGFPKGFNDVAVYLDLPNLELIANTTTDNDGNAHFSNLVDNQNPSYQYYIYVAPSENNINNFKPYGPTKINIPKNWNSENEISTSLDYKNPYSLDQKIRLEQEFPMITGTFYDEDNNQQPLEGVKILLDEFYVAINGYKLKYQTNPKNIFEEELAQKLLNKECPNTCGHHVYRMNLFGTPKDGRFRFDNLAILHDETKIHGNIVTFKIDKPGYELADQDGKVNRNTFVTSKALRMGEKMNIVISLKRGAHIKGQVVDAETNEKISGAKVFIIPDQIVKTTNFLGEFSDYPAMKLPGKEQLLVIEKANYEPDTFKVVIDKSDQDLGVFKIYKLKHRLAVFVSDNKTGKMISKALVRIKDVKSICFQNPNGCPLQKTTGIMGGVYFSFDNSEDNHEILVSVPSGLKNYEPQSISVNVPISKTPTIVEVKLNPATCIRGRIFAGESDNIPVDKAIVKEKSSTSSNEGMFLSNLLFGNSSDSISAYSDAQGHYFKRNVPLGFFERTYVAAKAQSQYIGDSWSALLNEPRDTNNCIEHDFHLTIYDDMDITHLLGFPIYITDLKSISHKKAEITGGFVNINSNNQFKIDKNTELEFGKITISAGEVEPGDTLPQAIPSKLPILTDKNSLDILTENLSSVLKRDKGIDIRPKAKGSHTGIIKGQVKLKNTSFNDNNLKLPDIYILDKEKNSDLIVFTADNNIKTPVSISKGLSVGDKKGNNIKYTLNGFSDIEALAKNSYIQDKKLILNSILHTNIESINPKDIKLNIGDIIISQSGSKFTKVNSQLSIKIDKWTMNSNDWNFDSEGLVLKKGIIDAKGFQVKFDNFKIKEDNLDGTLAKFYFNDVKLLGIKKLNIVSDDVGFSYGNVHDNIKAYQINIAKNDQMDYCAYIDHLPGLKSSDKITFRFVLLHSDGNTKYPLNSGVINLYDLVDFRPDANSVMDITSNLFQIHGKLILNYPKVSAINTNISFQNNSGQLQFGLNATHPINFTNNGLITRLNNVELSHHLLKASGTVEEPGAFPSTKVILTHTPDKIEVDIAENEKIQISSSNYFNDVVGEMHVDGDKWTTFWFEGYPMGMKGISDNNPKKMKFTVNGVVTASGQSIDIKKVDSPFGEMSFSYNLPKSELTGYCQIDKTVGGLGLKGGVETLAGVNGWYFMTTGTVTVPSFGEVELYGIFGDYTGSVSQSNPGGFKCLPAAFQNKISGFLISGYFQRNIFDPIDWDYELVSVKAGLDVGLAARFYTSFEKQGTLFGLGLKLYGHAYFEGSLETTCTSVGVNAEANIGINSTYNTATKYFTIDGCAGISLTLYGEQCLGTMGLCSDACLRVDVGTIDLSAVIKGDSNGELNYSLQKKQCSDCD